MMPSDRAKQEAISRFLAGLDTREDRDVLRSAGIVWVTLPGGARRNIPTLEEEDLAEMDDSDNPSKPRGKRRPGPRVWKINDPKSKEA